MPSSSIARIRSLATMPSSMHWSPSQTRMTKNLPKSSSHFRFHTPLAGPSALITTSRKSCSTLRTSSCRSSSAGPTKTRTLRSSSTWYWNLTYLSNPTCNLSQSRLVERASQSREKAWSSSKKTQKNAYRRLTSKRVASCITRSLLTCKTRSKRTSIRPSRCKRPRSSLMKRESTWSCKISQVHSKTTSNCKRIHQSHLWKCQTTNTR